MTNNPCTILCTRPVDEALARQAREAGIVLEFVSMIETVPVTSDSLRADVEKYADRECLVIITSMNAADVVIGLLNGQAPSWKLFCTGNTTRELLEQHFGKQNIIATAGSSGALAEALIDWFNKHRQSNPVIFFCGNRRRDELPGLLEKAGIPLKEIETYKTIETALPVTRHYDAILFFSPSAVSSFFSMNNAGSDTVLFAIGKTTERTIAQYSGNKIVVGNTPSKNDLVKQAIAYFHARHTGQNP